jgi:capsular polysaccharide biosynthesis protein
MEDKLSLKEVFKVIRKGLWLIISLTIGAGIIAAIISFFILKPVYQNSSQFLVNQNNRERAQEFTENDIRTNVELINTYKIIIKSPRILDRVKEELNLKKSIEDIAENIDVSSEESSQVVTVLVTDQNPKLAANIANTTVRIFQNEIPQLMNVDNVKVLSKAELSANPDPVSPNKVLNIVIAMVLGALSGAGIGFLLEYTDNRIKTEYNIVEKLHTPVLGVISHIGDKEISKNSGMQTVKKKEGVVLDGAS